MQGRSGSAVVWVIQCVVTSLSANAATIRWYLTALTGSPAIVKGALQVAPHPSRQSEQCIVLGGAPMSHGRQVSQASTLSSLPSLSRDYPGERMPKRQVQVRLFIVIIPACSSRTKGVFARRRHLVEGKASAKLLFWRSIPRRISTVYRR